MRWMRHTVNSVGTVRNFVCEAMMMGTQGANHMAIEKDSPDQLLGPPRPEGRVQ